MSSQIPLIKLSDEELMERSRELAYYTLQLMGLQIAHAKAKAEMLAVERELVTKIRHLARAVHDGGEPPE